MNERNYRKNRPQSFGIGGAGNIRRYQEAKVQHAPSHTDADTDAESTLSWRRPSSVFSRRSSVVSGATADSQARRGILGGFIEAWQRKRSGKKTEPITEEPAEAAAQVAVQA